MRLAASVSSRNLSASNIAINKVGMAASMIAARAGSPIGTATDAAIPQMIYGIAMSFTAVTAMAIGSMISITITANDMACTGARGYNLATQEVRNDGS